MNEKTAYKTAAECLSPAGGQIESHIGQQIADKIVAALLSVPHTDDMQPSSNDVHRNWNSYIRFAANAYGG